MMDVTEGLGAAHTQDDGQQDGSSETGGPNPTTSSRWAMFDMIYCINVLERPDRFDASKRNFRKAGIPLDKVQYHRPHKLKGNPIKGVWTSHTFCASQALDAGADNILILEDDAVATKELENPQWFLEVAHYMGTMDWKGDEPRMLFLGGVPLPLFHRPRRFGTREHDYQSIYEVNVLCFHAYVLNKAAIRLFANLSYLGFDIDTLPFLTSYIGCRARLPQLFDQDASLGTDNKPTQPLISTTGIKFATWYTRSNLPVSMAAAGMGVALLVLIAIGALIYHQGKKNGMRSTTAVMRKD